MNGFYIFLPVCRNLVISKKPDMKVNHFSLSSQIFIDFLSLERVKMLSLTLPILAPLLNLDRLFPLQLHPSATCPTFKPPLSLVTSPLYYRHAQTSASGRSIYLNTHCTQTHVTLYLAIGNDPVLVFSVVLLLWLVKEGVENFCLDEIILLGN